MNDERYLSTEYRAELGRIAYDADADALFKVGWQGMGMVVWEELTKEIQNVWIVVATAVANEVKTP